jgi:hypothetical protein
MSSRTFKITHFKSPIIVSQTPEGVKLAIEQEKIELPKGAEPKSVVEPRPFFIAGKSGNQFWNKETGGYSQTRARPNSIIGDWNVGRLIQVAFLERLFNLEARYFTIANYLSVFQDEAWDPIFEFIKVDTKASLD